MSSNYQGLHLKFWELYLATTTTTAIIITVSLKSNHNNSNLKSLKIGITSASHIFSLYQQNRSTDFWDNFQWKRDFKATKLAYPNKVRESIKFCFPKSVLNKGKTTIPPPFNCSEVCSFVPGKVKLSAEICSEKSTLNDASISLPDFPRTYMKQQTPTMIPKVINTLDFWF